MAQLLMKIWKEIKENHDLPNKKAGFSLSSGEYGAELGQIPNNQINIQIKYNILSI